MKFQNRMQDVGKVFDSQWKVNHNYQEKKQFLDNRKAHFNKMHNIVDKEERKKEILEANSINGKLQRLEQNMQSISSNELFRGKNNFR